MRIPRHFKAQENGPDGSTVVVTFDVGTLRRRIVIRGEAGTKDLHQPPIAPSEVCRSARWGGHPAYATAAVYPAAMFLKLEPEMISDIADELCVRVWLQIKEALGDVPWEQQASQLEAAHMLYAIEVAIERAVEHRCVTIEDVHAIAAIYVELLHTHTEVHGG